MPSWRSGCASSPSRWRSWSATAGKNEQLREYLEIKEEHSDFTFVSGSVVGRDASERFYSFAIDAGENAGVEKYDPVITSEGLVGLVSEGGPELRQGAHYPRCYGGGGSL